METGTGEAWGRGRGPLPTATHNDTVYSVYSLVDSLTHCRIRAWVDRVADDPWNYILQSPVVLHSYRRELIPYGCTCRVWLQAPIEHPHLASQKLCEQVLHISRHPLPTQQLG